MPVAVSQHAQDLQQLLEVIMGADCVWMANVWLTIENVIQKVACLEKTLNLFVR